jgi:tyrosyl-tRNA synthetase
MSQSLGNYVGITEPPRDIYGKLMSIADPLIEEYFILCTDVPEEEVKKMAAGMAAGELNPRDVKARLAGEIVAMYHSKEAARNAEEEFNRMFREKGLPDDIPAKEFGPSDLPIHLRTLMTEEGLAQSKAEARRLILQGGVRLDGEVVTDAKHEISEPGEYVLKVGKRRFLKLLVRT